MWMVVVIADHSDVADVTSAEPSLHKIAQEAAIASWNKIHPDLLRAVIESSAMSPNQLCSMCTNEATYYRCLSCSPTGYFCVQCF